MKVATKKLFRFKWKSGPVGFHQVFVDAADERDAWEVLERHGLANKYSGEPELVELPNVMAIGTVYR